MSTFTARGFASAALAAAVLLAPTAGTASKIPYLHGNTASLNVNLDAEKPGKYRKVIQLDMPEVYHGQGFVRFLQHLVASGQWSPKNNLAHIAPGQISDAIRAMTYRSVNGRDKIDPETNSGVSYRDMTDDPEGGQAHLFVQVRNNEHRIIAPPPWW